MLRNALLIGSLCAIGCATPAPQEPPPPVLPPAAVAPAPAEQPEPDTSPPEVAIATALGESAADHRVAGRLDEAVADYRRALAIWYDLQPESDGLVAETLANLALIHRARGEREQARALLERALPLYEKSLAPEDPTLARVRALIAASAAPPARPAPPEPSPAETARALDREGAELFARRDYVRARPVLERAVALHERAGTEPVELGASLSHLGRTYAGLGEREAARRTLRRSLALIEPALGKLDPLTLATRASLEHVLADYPANLR